MSEPRHCPHCAAEIPVNSPAGLCPRCLLLAANDSQSDVVSEPAATLLTPPAPASGFVPPTPEELAPLFPQLEILELLGKGGMGAVYKARQPGLDRLVAVKILAPGISRDPAFVERFQREARALAKLNHPHIVAVYDFGQTGGLCYIVMEFVDGVNLRQAIRTRTLTSVEALVIVPQVCEALQFAHDEGIVHRDIKPENILIDKRGRVKIADFGLAKLLGQDASDHSLTATHQVMGTLRYMAPEQMQGSREVDHRADIYSLGVVFYELLTGELPMGRFAPPSKKVQIDVRLDEVVLRALEQDPEQRYQHASDVKTDVDNITQLNARSATGRGDVPVPPKRNDGQTFALPVEPRLNRLAIWGVSLDVVGMISLLTVIFLGTVVFDDFLSVYFHPRMKPLWISIAEWVLGAIGVLTSLAGTACGAAGASEIRKSRGQLYGMPLAAGAAIFFPSLVLGGLTFGFTHLASIAVWTMSHSPPATLSDPPPARLYPGESFFFLDAIVSIVICFFAGRAAWQKIAGEQISNDGPVRPVPVFGGTPVTQLRFTVSDSQDVARQAIFHFSSLGYRLIEQQADVCVFQRGGQWAGLWETDLRKIHTILTVRTAPAAEASQWVSCDWSIRTLGAWVTRRDILKLEAEGRELETRLGGRGQPELSVTKPRFSRFAIAGLVWAVLGLLVTGSCLGGMISIVTEGKNFGPAVMPIFLLVAVITVFGTTILGAIAIGHIKRSGGKIIGLPLAVADAIFFPLLLVFAGIALPVSLLLHALLPLQMIAVAIPSSVLALIVCLGIGCAVWCKVIPDSHLMAISLREKLRLAGIGLLIAGIMDAFSVLLWIGQSGSVLVELLKQGSPFGWQLALTCLSLSSLMIVYYVIGVALHLMTLEDDGNFTFCLLTAAIVPPGCLIGLPIAIYALVQLSKPEVNALFPAKPPESATTRPVTIVETPPPKWKAALETWWLAQSNVTRQVLWIALNCLCAFCLFAFFSFKGTSDTLGNHLYQIGFLDPWFVFERRIGPGLRSTSGIFLAWSWLFGVGAYASGWLLFKLKRGVSH